MQQYFKEEEVEPLVDERRPWPIEMTSLNRSIHHPRAAFDDILDRFLGIFPEQRQSAQRRRQDITIEVTLSTEQARRGGTVRIMVPVEMNCPACFRSGSSRYYPCRRCNGAGTLRGDEPLLISYPPGINDNNSMELAFNRPMDQPLHLTVVFTVR
jgi:DnaJ-class molecular chaperone